MNIHLAGDGLWRWVLPERLEKMRLYLAGTYSRKYAINTEVDYLANICLLESFYYVDEWQTKSIPYLQSFMLDSGAFTFFSAGKDLDWDRYIRSYAEYIVKNDIKLFFELDIDVLVGYKKVRELRDKLEALTNRPCIPVWHKSRGKQDFIDMCQKYKYVAIGGIVSGEITKADYKYFPLFINTAHKYGAKIHGLGFTSLENLPLYHFDSVDSTAWVSGNKFGFVYKFNGSTMIKEEAPQGKRLKDAATVARHNFNEWVKFGIYARSYL